MHEDAYVHPLMTELSDLADGLLTSADKTRVTEHVGWCLSCRTRLQHGLEFTAERHVSQDLGPTPSVAISDELLARLRQEPREPFRGQLWRLRWEEHAALAVLLKVDGDDVTVMPVTLDPQMGDDYTIVVSESWSPLAAAVGIWVGLETVVPLWVLDRDLGDIDALDQIAEVRRAFRKGIAASEIVVVGLQVTDPTDERSAYRHEVGASFHALSEAEWLADGTFAGTESAPLLTEMLETVGPRQIAETLDLNAPSTFALLSGEWLVTEDQALLLEMLIGRPAAEILAAVPAPPSRLLRALSHPRHRAVIEARAAQCGLSGAQERREALAELLPVAARRSGDETAPLDWHQLVADRYEA